MLAMASPSFVISKIKSSNIFFGVNFDYAWSLNLRLMRTLGVERSSEKICYVLVSIPSNILAIKNLFQIKRILIKQRRFPCTACIKILVISIH